MEVNPQLIKNLFIFVKVCYISIDHMNIVFQPVLLVYFQNSFVKSYFIFIARALTSFNIHCIGLFKIQVCYLVLKTVKMKASDDDLDETMNLESDKC